MNGRGQGLGIEMLIIVIFILLIGMLFMSFIYPESSAEVLNRVFRTLYNLRWEEIVAFVLIVVVILAVSIILVLFHFTKIFKEREV